MTNIPPSIKSYSRFSTSEILDVSRRTVDRLLKKGVLRGYRVGAQIRITEDSIKSLVEENQISAGIK